MAKQKERNDKLREEKEKLKKEKEELQKQKEEDESKKVSTLVLHVSSQNGWRALFSMCSPEPPFVLFTEEEKKRPCLNRFKPLRSPQPEPLD